MYGEAKTEPDLENIAQLEYLDMFIKEALRMYPVSSKYFNLLNNFLKSLKFRF
jgi:hypothetical protein